MSSAVLSSLSMMEIPSKLGFVSEAEYDKYCAEIQSDLGKRYQVQRFINRGGFATVWQVLDQIDQSVIAVKRFHPQFRARRDFFQELRSLFRLNNCHVVQIINFLESANNTRYLLLEYCVGGSLRSTLNQFYRRNEKASAPLILRWAKSIVEGLSAAHQLNIIHRDLKPENLLFADLDKQILKIADFGLARNFRENDISSSRLKQDGLTGSPAYMAPEQFSERYLKESDLYSLGVILYELLYARLPFMGSPDELARQHLYQLPVFPDGIAANWKSLLKGLLQKAPNIRPTLSELKKELAKLENESFQESSVFLSESIPGSSKFESIDPKIIPIEIDGNKIQNSQSTNTFLRASTAIFPETEELINQEILSKEIDEFLKNRSSSAEFVDGGPVSSQPPSKKVILASIEPNQDENKSDSKQSEITFICTSPADKPIGLFLSDDDKSGKIFVITPKGFECRQKSDLTFLQQYHLPGIRVAQAFDSILFLLIHHSFYLCQIPGDTKGEDKQGIGVDKSQFPKMLALNKLSMDLSNPACGSGEWSIDSIALNRIETPAYSGVLQLGIVSKDCLHLAKIDSIFRTENRSVNHSHNPELLQNRIETKILYRSARLQPHCVWISENILAVVEGYPKPRILFFSDSNIIKMISLPGICWDLKAVKTLEDSSIILVGRILIDKDFHPFWLKFDWEQIVCGPPIQDLRLIDIYPEYKRYPHGLNDQLNHGVNDGVNDQSGKNLVPALLGITNQGSWYKITSKSKELVFPSRTSPSPLYREVLVVKEDIYTISQFNGLGQIGKYSNRIKNMTRK